MPGVACMLSCVVVGGHADEEFSNATPSNDPPWADLDRNGWHGNLNCPPHRHGSLRSGCDDRPSSIGGIEQVGGHRRRAAVLGVIDVRLDEQLRVADHSRPYLLGE